MTCHATLVEVRHAVHLSLRAEHVVAGQALHAVAAAVVVVTPASSFALLEHGYVGTDSLDGTNALMAQAHVNTLVVNICAAETGMCDLQKNFVCFQLWFLGLRFDDALVRAFEYCERWHVDDVLGLSLYIVLGGFNLIMRIELGYEALRIFICSEGYDPVLLLMKSVHEK